MSKKYRIDVGSIVDNETGQIYSEIQVRNLLNKYDEENKQLKSKLESAEKVLQNIGYELVYSETYEKWLIE